VTVDSNGGRRGIGEGMKMRIGVLLLAVAPAFGAQQSVQVTSGAAGGGPWAAVQ
jgi:hypothetical protein